MTDRLPFERFDLIRFDSGNGSMMGVTQPDSDFSLLHLLICLLSKSIISHQSDHRLNVKISAGFKHFL